MYTFEIFSVSIFVVAVNTFCLFFEYNLHEKMYYHGWYGSHRSMSMLVTSQILLTHQIYWFDTV